MLLRDFRAPSRVAISGGPNGNAVFTGADSADGTLTTQTMPGGITQLTRVDIAGETDEPGIPWTGGHGRR